MTFYSIGSWKFDYDFARSVIALGILRQNNFYILVEDPTYGLNGSFQSLEK